MTIQPIFETILELTPLYEVIWLNILSARIQGVVEFPVHLLNLLEGKVAFQKGRPAYLLIPNSFSTLGIKSKICKGIYKPLHTYHWSTKLSVSCRKEAAALSISIVYYDFNCNASPPYSWSIRNEKQKILGTCIYKYYKWSKACQKIWAFWCINLIVAI